MQGLILVLSFFCIFHASKCLQCFNENPPLLPYDKTLLKNKFEPSGLKFESFSTFEGVGNECDKYGSDIILLFEVAYWDFPDILQDFTGIMESIFYQIKIGQDKLSTRVAIFTYTSKVTQILDLTLCTNFTTLYTALEKVPSYHIQDNSVTAYRQDLALAAAENLFAIQSNSNRQKGVIFISRVYEDQGMTNLLNTANRMKAKNVTIMATNYGSNQCTNEGFEKLVTPGYFFNAPDSNLTENVLNGIRSISDYINCSCPNGRRLFEYVDPVFGQLIKSTDCLYGFFAETAPDFIHCQDGILGIIDSQTKLDFIINTIWKPSLLNAKKFYIGLKYSSALKAWAWQGYNGTEYSLEDFPQWISPPASNSGTGYLYNYYGFRWGAQLGNDNILLPYVCQSKSINVS